MSDSTHSGLEPGSSTSANDSGTSTSDDAPASSADAPASSADAPASSTATHARSIQWVALGLILLHLVLGIAGELTGNRLFEIGALAAAGLAGLVILLGVSLLLRE